ERRLHRRRRAPRRRRRLVDPRRQGGEEDRPVAASHVPRGELLMRHVFSFVFTGVVVAGIVAACSVSVDLAGKGCPCPDGLLCDTTTNTCVATLPAPTSTSTTDGGGPPVAACNAGECPCKVNADCHDPKRAYCGPGGT